MPTLQSINASASPEVQMNQNFYAVAAAALFGRKDSTTAGLTLGYYGGIIGGIGTFATIADGTVLLTGSTTNYIEATTAGVVSANTTAFTAGRQPLYTAVTSSTAITTLTDYRVILPSMSTGSVTYSTLTLATGTITADTPALSITQTWNNAGVNFIAADTNITNTASGASSMLHRWRVGGAVKASIDYLGAMVLAAGLTLGSALVGATTQAAFNTVTTTLNIGGAATAINMGAGASSTLTASFTTAIALNTAAISSNQTTVALLATPTTVNFAQGASIALNIGHASGTNTVAGATTFSQRVAGSSHFHALAGGSAPASGSGLEMFSASGNGYVGAYNRTGAAYLPLILYGSSIALGDSAVAVTIPGTLGVTGVLTTGDTTHNGNVTIGTTGYLKFGTTGYIISPSTSGLIINNNADTLNIVLFNNDQTVRMYGYGAGTATFSANGTISSVSDERLKIKDGAIKNPIAMLNALEPGYFYGKPEANMGEDRQLGFYAQNVRKAIGPEAAPNPVDGKPWGYFDRSVLAVAIESVKNHEARLCALELNQ